MTKHGRRMNQCRAVLTFSLQSLASMGMAPQPVKSFDELTNGSKQRPASAAGQDLSFNPFIYGNDIDSVDIATRVAMVSEVIQCG